MIACRVCGLSKPSSEYYVAGRWVNKICKPCMISYQREYRRKKYNRPGERELICGNCGKTFVSVHKKAQFCSRACKCLARQMADRDQRFAAKSIKECAHCGKEMPQTYRSDAKFCSEQCNSAAHQWWRKSASRSGKPRKETKQIVRLTVAARDGGICQLCGDSVDPQLSYPDPKAASIDHVVPLARGGTHELSNLQLAHLVCNWRKRADQSCQLIG